MLQQHWKKIVIGIVVLVVAVLGYSFWYAKYGNQADKPVDQSTADSLLDATTTSPATEPSPSTALEGTTTTEPVGADGTWSVSPESIVGYRVKESINGFSTEANGRTNAVTGSLVISGTTASSGEFTVDMTTFKSDESRRDGQFNGRIMSVDEFPTSTFVLTQPIDFGEVPSEGGTIPATASGDLTLRGVTKPVTFEISATYRNGRIAVLGNIPVVFADFGIPNPSIATISTEDNGLLEFVLIFDRAA